MNCPKCKKPMTNQGRAEDKGTVTLGAVFHCEDCDIIQRTLTKKVPQ